MSGMLLQTRGANGLPFTRPPPITGITGGIAGTDLPGKPGGSSPNPVGFAAAAGYVGNADGSGLTPSPWPPAGWVAGVDAAHPTTFSHLDFDMGSENPVLDTTPGELPGVHFNAQVMYMSIDGLNSNDSSINPGLAARPINNIKFVGCRFGSSDARLNTAMDCVYDASNNITYSYCSFTPSPAKILHPPAPAWPSGNVGQGVGFLPDVHPAYMVPYKYGTGFQLAALAPPGGLITVDHCEFWGSGDNIACGGFSTIPHGTLLVQDCWIHDCRDGTGPPWNSATAYAKGDVAWSAVTGDLYYAKVPNTNLEPSANNGVGFPWKHLGSTDHTDGIITGAQPGDCNHVTIDHCVFATIGNTNGLAFQDLQANSHYSGSVTYGVPTYIVASDNNWYKLISPVPAGTDPIADGGVHWILQAAAYYHDISVTRSYFTWGGGVCCDVCGGSIGNNHITFANNIIATDFPFVREMYGDYTFQFSSNATMHWHGNILQVYPGDTWTHLGASYPGPTSDYNGYFIYPDGTKHLADYTGAP